MGTRDGRTATAPYRVRVAGTWYWVDPTLAASTIAPGDTVIVYPVAGDAVLAVLRPPSPDALAFTTLGGERFEVPERDIATMHLAAVDPEQG